jgi:leader peptidase (prepilin peptidase) / N-methyltransferase
LLEAILAGLFGALIGSFLNVCIYRLPRDLSVVSPRSSCPNCEKLIAWYDNVPVLSFIVLRARCRNCREPISWRYPMVELLTGLLFFVGVMKYGPTLVGVKFCIFAAIQVALIFTDFEERILPDEFTIGGTFAGLLLAAFLAMPPGLTSLVVPPGWNPRLVSVLESGVAALFVSGVLWGFGALYQNLRHKEGLGFGDVKMVMMFGAFLGIQGTLLTLIVGSVMGSVAGVAYILVKRVDASTYELPFGSFLGIGALGVALYGSSVLAWYGRF